MGAAAPSGIRWRPALLVAMAALAAQALPVALVIFQSSVRPKFISSTYGPPYILFELFGFSGSLFIGLALWIGSRSQPPSPIRQLRLLAFAVVACSALLLITECTQESYDYRCYQAAAQAFLAGTPAYGQGYIYPPLMATGLAAFYRVLGPLLGFPEKITWYLVFYAWQTLQFFLYVGAFELTLQAVWRRLPASRSPRNTAILLCATTLIFVVNNALLRTMRFNQVNLLVLDSALVALLLFERFPVVAALSLAFGIHLKLYPLLLAVPLLLLRRLRDALSQAHS